MNKELLTLITDKIDRTFLIIGANKTSAWRSQVENEYCIFSRIKSISYSKSYHENAETYDHCISILWKELLGKGYKDEVGCGLQDEVGNWHYPIDAGFRLHLWHPSKQGFQEKIAFTDVNWRPTYNYSEAEVIEALKLICETFGLEFSQETDGRWFTQRCGHGGMVLDTTEEV